MNNINPYSSINIKNEITLCKKEMPSFSVPTFRTGWFFQDGIVWKEHLVDKYNNKSDINCLEIGSWEGMSTIFTAENMCNGENSKIDAIDIWNGDYITESSSYADGSNELLCRFVLNTQKFDNLSAYRGTSFEVLSYFSTEVLAGVREKYDFIYIDGSHWAKDALVDAVLSWEILKVGGIMVFDDVWWKAPNGSDQPHIAPHVTVKAFLDIYATMYSTVFDGYQHAVQKNCISPIDATHIDHIKYCDSLGLQSESLDNVASINDELLEL
jgi:predicted O-methyltransferase YrrM